MVYLPTSIVHERHHPVPHNDDVIHTTPPSKALSTHDNRQRPTTDDRRRHSTRLPHTDTMERKMSKKLGKMGKSMRLKKAPSVARLKESSSKRLDKMGASLKKKMGGTSRGDDGLDGNSRSGGGIISRHSTGGGGGGGSDVGAISGGGGSSSRHGGKKDPMMGRSMGAIGSGYSSRKSKESMFRSRLGLGPVLDESPAGKTAVPPPGGGGGGDDDDDGDSASMHENASTTPVAPPSADRASACVDDFIIHEEESEEEEKAEEKTEEDIISHASSSSSHDEVDFPPIGVGSSSNSDDDSVMAMSEEGELIGEREEDDEADSLYDDDASAVSDDDYYRQDYYMLGRSSPQTAPPEDREGPQQTRPSSLVETQQDEAEIDDDRGEEARCEAEEDHHARLYANIYPTAPEHAEDEDAVGTRAAAKRGMVDDAAATGDDDDGEADDGEADDGEADDDDEEAVLPAPRDDRPSDEGEEDTGAGAAESALPSATDVGGARGDGDDDYDEDDHEKVDGTKNDDGKTQETTGDDVDGPADHRPGEEPPLSSAATLEEATSSELRRRESTESSVQSAELDSIVATIRSLVEITQPGKSAEKLLAAYEGRERSLLKFLMKLEKEQRMEQEQEEKEEGGRKPMDGSAQPCPRAIGVGGNPFDDDDNTENDDEQKPTGKVVDESPNPSSDAVDPRDPIPSPPVEEGDAIADDDDDAGGGGSPRRAPMHRSQSELDFEEFEAMLRRSANGEGVGTGTPDGAGGENSAAAAEGGAGRDASAAAEPVDDGNVAGGEPPGISANGEGRASDRNDDNNDDDNDSTTPENGFAAGQNDNDIEDAANDDTKPKSGGGGGFAAMLKKKASTRLHHSSASASASASAATPVIDDDDGGNNSSSPEKKKGFASMLKKANSKLHRRIVPSSATTANATASREEEGNDNAPSSPSTAGDATAAPAGPIASAGASEPGPEPESEPESESAAAESSDVVSAGTKSEKEAEPQADVLPTPAGIDREGIAPASHIASAGISEPEKESTAAAGNVASPAGGEHEEEDNAPSISIVSAEIKKLETKSAVAAAMAALATPKSIDHEKETTAPPSNHRIVSDRIISETEAAATSVLLETPAGIVHEGIGPLSPIVSTGSDSDDLATPADGDGDDHHDAIVAPASPIVSPGSESETTDAAAAAPPTTPARGGVDNLSALFGGARPPPSPTTKALPSTAVDSADTPPRARVVVVAGSGDGTASSRSLAAENHKLRKRRKELLALLGSTAQQFSAYESVCMRKISKLEERNRELERTPRERADSELASTVAGELSGAQGGEGRKYGGDVVRRLSNGVLMQEKQLKSKDELITQLKLRCDVLKQTLADKDEEHLKEKKSREEEEGRSDLPKKVDSPVPSPTKERHGELLSKKMECKRLKKELETATGDIEMLTTALETNNESLDAAVLELNRLQVWKKRYGEAAAVAVGIPDTPRAEDAEKLRNELKEKEVLKSELKEKDEQRTRLQRDLETSREEIEGLRESVNAAASAKGYNQFQNVVEDLKKEADSSRKDADLAKERIRQLETELESKKGEMDNLRSSAPSSRNHQLNRSWHSRPSAVAEDDAIGASGSIDAGIASPFGKRMGLGGLRKAFGGAIAQRPIPEAVGKEEEPIDFPGMLKQRDLKIKSLDAMIRSYLRIIDKMRGDIERMDSEKGAAEYNNLRRIEQLEEENKTYEIQVMGFEKAFMALNEQRVGHSTTTKSSPQQHDNESDIVDDNMWDEEDYWKDDSGVRAENMALQRSVEEWKSNCSFQEDQIEKLKADLIRLRVKSQQEKESALTRMAEENEIVVAQRSALEKQFGLLNESAGALRKTMDQGGAPQTPGSRGEGESDSDTALVGQVVMLENANKVLESSVENLRTGMQEKLAPMLERIALLEEEKRMVEEEMETKLNCREETINNLEESLKMQKGGRYYKIKFSKKFSKKGLKFSTTPPSPDAPDQAAGGH